MRGPGVLLAQEPDLFQEFDGQLTCDMLIMPAARTRSAIDLGKYLYCPIPSLETFFKAALRTCVVMTASDTNDMLNHLSEVWTWLALPVTWIQTLIDTGSVNVSALPGQGQLNFGQTPYQALIKLGHWIRQGSFSFDVVPGDTRIGMILFHPLHTRLSIDFRTGEGRGGQLNFHNVSYIGSSFLTTWSPDSALFQFPLWN